MTRHTSCALNLQHPLGRDPFIAEQPIRDRALRLKSQRSSKGNLATSILDGLAESFLSVHGARLYHYG